MSSAVTTATVAETDQKVEKVPKKFPPPCWTQEETLCLIEAYRERWYALRRGYLRTPDWDGVASTVSGQFPDITPAKTSAQCRHKMEKLRQRYRAEKQRALTYPYPAGRYFSSWFFFDYMEAMENGTTVQATNVNVSSEGSRLKSFLDDNIMKLKIKEKSEVGASNPVFGFENGVRGKRSKISYLDVENVGKGEEDGIDDEVFMNMGRRKLMNGIPTPPISSRGRMVENFDDNGGGFRQQMLPPELRFKKSDRRTDFYDRGSNSNEEMWSNNVPSSRANYWDRSSARGNKMSGSKRGRSVLEEMADSIKLLGEGFVKMERAKMEMAREMETMRMEMEMKRNEMLLESQKQIVDAFVKGFFEMKSSKKVKAAGVDAADSAGT